MSTQAAPDAGAARHLRAAGQGTLGILADLIEQERPIFAMPSWFVTEDSVLVVLDEAYREFLTDPDVPDGIPLALERENVAVLRTFSKAYALAGVRIGYWVAPPPIAAGTAKVRVPFAVSRLAQAAGLAALEHADEVGARCETVIRERERLSAAMREAGHDVPPSQANFLWLPLRERSARFGEHGAESGIMVRVFGKDGVRVTVGLPKENDAFLRAAQSLLTLSREAGHLVRRATS
ncbi:aminotransferase class I/II-fold pyridoxal phosphate-dependent enzyme [Streptomyces caniferus]|uniref:aminotransferase class I/II-fold pyridoxal phosphate-dependent enzyme n=1 Tax=Streptomyces caniferus TaxID=285557 RepID=UPI0033EBF556